MKTFVAFLILALALSQALARTPAELPPDAVIVAELGAAVDVATLEHLRQDALAAKSGGRRDLSPILFEPAAYRLLGELAGIEPTAEQRRWVGSLRGYQPRLWRQHPETLTPWYMPVFDLGSQAEALLEHWQRRDDLASLTRDISGERRWTDKLLAAEPALQAAVIGGLHERALDGLIEAGIPDALASASWRQLLTRRMHFDVWKQGLVRAPDDALRAVAARVWELRSDEQARDWLEQLRRHRPQLASSAVLALRVDPDARARQQRLLELVADARDYAAAAAALADDGDLSDEALIAQFEATPPGLARRGLALTLRLRDSQASRDFLAAWLARTQDDAGWVGALR